MASFESIFPTFLQKCAELNELLRIVAVALFIVGTIMLVTHGFAQLARSTKRAVARSQGQQQTKGEAVGV
jgi:threonine/homoserine/homoserine lactone efflux protein